MVMVGGLKISDALLERKWPAAMVAAHSGPPLIRRSVTTVERGRRTLTIRLTPTPILHSAGFSPPLLPTL